MTTFFSVALVPDDLDFLADLHLAALDAAGHDRATTRDREHVLDRHQERLVHLALRQRNVGVERLHQLEDGLNATRIALKRLERRDAHDRQVVAREAVALQQLAHFELDQVEQFGIVDRVALVQRHDHERHVDLLGQQHVLARLRHRTVDRADHQNRAVHLGGARDHVLDVVGVPRAVDVRVVPIRRRVLDVTGRDRQDLRLVAAALRLGGLRHLVVRHELGPALVSGHLGERCRQRRLAVVDVADRANVHVRLRTIKLLFRHCSPSSLEWQGSLRPAKLSLDAGPFAPCRLLAHCLNGGAALADHPYRTRLAQSQSGADDRDRTGDLVLTKDVLCQLSYIGLRPRCIPRSGFGRHVGHSPKHPRSADLAARPGASGLPDEAVSAASVRRSLERETGIEPATNSLEGCDSTTELLPPSACSALAHSASFGGAGPPSVPDPIPSHCSRPRRPKTICP